VTEAFFLRTRAMPSVKPVLQALVLAEHVYEDRLTHKKIIAGTFNTVQYGKTEHQEIESGEGRKAIRVKGGMNAGSPWTYINLTEIHGHADFVLQYVDLKHHTVLMSTRFAVECDSPLHNVEVVIPLPELPTPHPGTYALELLSDDFPIGSLRVEVKNINAEGEKHEHD
jgi:hypothetical protein